MGGLREAAVKKVCEVTVDKITCDKVFKIVDGAKTVTTIADEKISNREKLETLLDTSVAKAPLVGERLKKQIMDLYDFNAKLEKTDCKGIVIGSANKNNKPQLEAASIGEDCKPNF